MRAGPSTSTIWRIHGRARAPRLLGHRRVEKRLAIEADGGHHLTEAGLKADTQRTRNLKSRGLRVLRVTDREILLQGAAVLAAIEDALGSY